MRLILRPSTIHGFVLCIAAFALYCCQHCVAFELQTPSTSSGDNGRHSFLSQASTENNSPRRGVAVEGYDHSRRRLSQSQDASQRQNDFECSLDASVVQSIYNEATQQWTVDDTTLDELSNDVQSIVNCTAPDDVVLFQTERILQMQETITVPWNLTLISFSEAGLLDNGEIRNIESKTANSTSNIVEWSPECNGTRNRNQGHFIHVNFEDNTLFDNAHLIDAGTASCARTEMTNVVIQENRCAGTHCIILSEDNILRNLQVLENNGSSDAAQNLAMFSCGRDSTTVVRNMTSLRNELQSFLVQSGTLRVSNSHFEDNRHNPSRDPSDTVGGGGVIFSNRSTIAITDSSFIGNNASTGGSISALGSVLNISHCIFDGNGAQNGGCLSLDMFSDVNISNCSFTNNIVSEDGGAIRLDSNTTLAIYQSNFTRNEAEVGGALMFRSSNVSAESCEFSKNRGRVRAGALLLASSRLTMHSCQMNLNQGGHGGAIYSREGATVEITRTNFSSNTAENNGGAFYTMRSSTLNITGSRFAENNATSGGSIYFYNSSIALISDCSFLDSIASRSGGAINAFNSSVLSLSQSNFTSNNASNGGSVRLSRFTGATMTNCRFMSSRATENGGSIAVDTASTLSITHSIFTGNEGVRGGAIRLDSSRLTMNASQLHSNQAEYGGAIQSVDLSSVSITESNFTSNSADPNGGAIVIEERCSLNTVRSNFTANTASYGGTIFATLNSSTSITDSNFAESESSENGGAILIHEESDLSLLRCNFANNSASSSGGCVGMRGFCNATVRDCTFRTCQARGKGGAIYVHLSSSLLFSYSILEGNQGRSGGGLEALEGSNVTAEFSEFMENNASESGGVLYLQNSNVTLLSSELVSNEAQYGGAIGIYDDSVLEAINSTFERNSVQEQGGAIHAISSNATLTGVQITSNKASSSGGGVYSLNGSHIVANNISIVSNSAGDEGGGIAVVNGSSLLCYSCNFINNRASSGAGLFVFSNESIPIVAQLENSAVEDNNATSHGGGLEFAAPQNRSINCNDPNVTCGHILLLNTSFIDNYAQFTGAAVLTTNTGRVLVSCNYSETRNRDFLTDQEVSSLEPIDPEELCPTWVGNRSSTDAYQGIVGTFARSISLSVASEEVRLTNHTDRGLVLESVSSGRPLPDLRVTLLDEYGLGPAPTQPPTIEATLSSPDGFFSGVYPINVTAGSGRFTEVIGFARPKNYTVEVRSETDELATVSVRVVVRECSVGEESTAEGRFCQNCSSLEYNFDKSEENGCRQCPENANCTGRYIIPNDGHWHRSPCHDTVKECLVEAACTRENRTDLLNNFTQSFTDCEWNTSTLEAYNQALCKEVIVSSLFCNCVVNYDQGYEGPLCGSCQNSYGLSLRFECLKCQGKFLALLLLVLIVIYLIAISAITIRGCLPLVSILSRPSRLRVIETQRDGAIEHEPVDEGVNYQMVEMMALGHVPSELLQSRERTTVGITPPIKHTEEMEMTRWKSTEVLKILINFVQTTTIAASINFEWTDGVEDMFSTSEYIGALTTAALSNPIDCLISADSAHTRSMLRIILSILLIALVVAVFIVLWTVITIRENKGIRYFLKRSLLSVIAVLYISYLGLTKLAVRMFYCVDVYDSEDPLSDAQNTYLAVDTSIECFKKDHVPLIVIAVFVLFFVSFLFPLSSAIILSRHKAEHRKTGSWTLETMGFLFRAFKEDFVFWESLIMLRKAGLSIIVVFSYPLDGQIQGLLALVVLLFSLYLQLTCMPYRKEFHSLNHYESGSLLVSCFTFILGQFLDSDKCSDTTKETVAVIIILLNIAFLSFLLFSFFRSSIYHCRVVLQYEGVCISDDAKWWTVLKTFVSFRASRCCE